MLSLLRKEYSSLEGVEVWCACSGGADSISLFHILNNLKSVLKFELGIIHIHHGSAEDPSTEEFRNRAFEFVKGLSQSSGVSFKDFKSEVPLKSEEEFRDFRINCFKSLSSEQLVMTGHHRQDFLETVLIQLIRGSGPQGLGGVFFDPSEQIIHPLLEVSKKEIGQFLKDRSLGFIEDPSNNEDVYFRNWLRLNWLPLLEDHRPGALNSLSQSLELVCQAMKESNDQSYEGVDLGVEEVCFSMVNWLSLSPWRRQSLVALIFRHFSSRGYSLGQIKETLKCLDLPQKSHRFTLGELHWTVDHGRIKVRLKTK